MSSAILHIINGVVQNPKVVEKLYSDLKDGRYLLEAKKKNQRTLPQNSYLHGVLIPEFKNAFNNAGYDEVRTYEQAKSLMKSAFLKTYLVNEETGESFELIKDTHSLTTVEFNNLVEEVIKFCAEKMNYQIPYPNEQLQIFE